MWATAARTLDLTLYGWFTTYYKLFYISWQLPILLMFILFDSVTDLTAQAR